MARLACPHLHGDVELTEEREEHIRERHPDLLAKYGDRLKPWLGHYTRMARGEPDQVRRSARFGNARLFSRWFDNIMGGKHVVVVVVSDVAPSGRHWVVAAYLVRKLAEGEAEWKRN